MVGYSDCNLLMAATQPFISGAISKTVNMPANCTVEDIRQGRKLIDLELRQAALELVLAGRPDGPGRGGRARLLVLRHGARTGAPWLASHSVSSFASVPSSRYTGTRRWP